MNENIYKRKHFTRHKNDDGSQFYTCNYCDNKCGSLGGIRSHVSTKHPIEYQQKIEKQDLEGNQKSEQSFSPPVIPKVKFITTNRIQRCPWCCEKFELIPAQKQRCPKCYNIVEVCLDGILRRGEQ